ncbi:MAG: hypothetical protein JRJ66_02780 [Deltaproteobacteria bacterium]|nr:hypothetical protein [Deltaproteobacteria bacterium]
MRQKNVTKARNKERFVAEERIERDRESEQRLKRDYLTNLNLHLPSWARQLVDLYNSPLKYRIKYELVGDGLPTGIST